MICPSSKRIEEIRSVANRCTGEYPVAMFELLALIDAQAEQLRVAREGLQWISKDTSTAGTSIGALQDLAHETLARLDEMERK